VRPPLRRLFAFAVALLAALAGASELAAHSHGAGGRVLAAEVGVRSTAAAPCAPTQHFDPAEVDHHPACPACLSGCARQGISAPTPLLAAAPARALSGLADAAPPAPAAVRRLPNGRGPPRA